MGKSFKTNHGYIRKFLGLTVTLYGSHVQQNERPRPKVNAEEQNPAFVKWIVVTSNSLPTFQIAKLSQIPGWQLVLVGDKKTPTNWTHPNTIFLDTATQQKLGYRVLQHLPWNSYTRKVIGYLYAIQHGAQVIYDTDDDITPNGVKAFDSNFELKSSTRGLIMTSSEQNNHVKNPYAHFGQRLIWPRGFPREQIGQKYNDTYTLCPSLRTPLIQQGLINGEADVDAIFRLTTKNLHGSLNIQFDGYAPPVFYPRQLFAPFNSLNTLFHYGAFWALLLPTSVAFRFADIWRGYWAQPLLWRMGGQLGFYATETVRLKNDHLHLKDFGEEDQMHNQTTNLISLLSSWSCSSSSTSFYNCMIQLTETMEEHKMWTGDHVTLVQAWIEDLKSVGYKTPEINEEQFSPTYCVEQSSRAVFSGAEMKRKKEIRPKYKLRKFCNFTSSSFTAGDNISVEEQPSGKNKVTFPSKLLVVTFNNPKFHQVIWLLDLIYRPHYPNILYCGKIPDTTTYNSLTSSKEFLDVGVTQFSIVDADIQDWEFIYECSIRAIEMNYGVQGYIVLSDDVLFNFWNNGNFDQNEVWGYKTGLDFRNSEIPYNNEYWDRWHWRKQVGWLWWKQEVGLVAAMKALKTIYSSKNEYLSSFVENRENYGYNSSIVASGMSDIFYIPAAKREVFYEVAKVLRENQVFLEIAVPTLLSGLSSPEKFVDLPAKWVWGDDRDVMFKWFNISSSALHPVKLGQVIEDMKFRKEFCQKYVDEILKLSY